MVFETLGYINKCVTSNFPINDVNLETFAKNIVITNADEKISLTYLKAGIEVYNELLTKMGMGVAFTSEVMEEIYQIFKQHHNKFNQS